MDIHINLQSNDTESKKITLNHVHFQKMVFLYNAINDGWSVKKQNQSYIFKKNHEGKREIYEESYLDTFVKENFDVGTLLSKERGEK